MTSTLTRLSSLSDSPCPRRVACGLALFGYMLTLGCGRETAPVAATPRAKTPWGTDVHWAREIIELEPVRPPLASGIDADALLRALEDEAGLWNEALVSCRAPRIRIGPLVERGVARDDAHNRVVVKVGNWCPDDEGDDAVCYDPTRQAKTHLRPRHDEGPRDGEIREADIEINAVSFRWSLDGDAPGTRSLRAIVAHEIGHVLGLDHSCGLRAGDGGAPARCDLPAAMQSIMYPDPTELGRPLVLAPTRDAVDTLCGPSTTPLGKLTGAVEQPRPHPNRASPNGTL